MTCDRCGRVPHDQEPAALTWSRSCEGGREQWSCAECTREHVRSIEGRLDQAWW